MGTTPRLPAGERKKEIREAAKRIFLKKGFRDTTMEDVIAETGMSKGGVYRHYKSTADMLYDLMLDGNSDRYHRIDEFLSCHPQLELEEMAIEISVMKLLDKSEYKSLYAMFLMEVKKNPRMKELWLEIEERSKKEYLEFFHKRKLDSLSFLMKDEWIALVNSIIVATEVLEVRELFLDHKDLFTNLIRQYLNSTKEEELRK